MERDDREILVGMADFVAPALALELSYGGSRLKPVSDYALTATSNRVDGLSIGDDMRLSGVKAGSVEQQILDDRYRALVTLRITADVKMPTDTAAVEDYGVNARFYKIGGLKKDRDLRISGIKVGTVVDHSLDPETFDAVGMLSIATEGLLGDKYVRLESGT